MAKFINTDHLRRETQAFFICMHDLGCKVPLTENGDPIYQNHPADAWTLAALNKLSINGSFT